MATTVKQENRWRKLVFGLANERARRQLSAEAAAIPRKQRPAVVMPDPNPSRRQVRSWMRANAADYDTATELAEGANAALNLPQSWLDDSEHWVWEEAMTATNGGEGEEA